MIILLILLAFSINQETVSNSAGTVVKVPASEEWTDTGMMVSAGIQVWCAVSPDAKIKCAAHSVNADGVEQTDSHRSIPLNDARLCSLIGKIGEAGKAFPIGLAEKPLVSDTTGKLFLGMNTDQFSENSGEWSVLTSTKPIQKKLVSVSAVKQWTSTGIKAQSHSHVVFMTEPSSRINCDRRPTYADAEGVIPFEPEFGRPVASFAACGLIGKVGKGQPFKIGLSPTPFEIKDPGELFLGINDTTLADNSGSFRVFVVIF